VSTHGGTNGTVMTMCHVHNILRCLIERLDAQNLGGILLSDLEAILLKRLELLVILRIHNSELFVQSKQHRNRDLSAL
jgi:hypothetical protein